MRAWRIVRSDRVLFASAVAALVLALAFAVGPVVVSALVGHASDKPHPYATDPLTHTPVGPLSWVYETSREYTDATGYARKDPPKSDAKKTLLLFGGDGTLGRDELLRVLEGGRTSLAVALGGTILAMLIGVALGSLAGFLGGWIDSVISRLTELVMAFPLLLLVIAIGSQSSNRFDSVTLGFLPQGVLSLIVLIGLFTWFYPARIIRTQVAELRSREFIDAAVMIGAKDLRILRTHIVPHVLPTALVYTTLLIPVNILLEAGITFLGVGIKLPTPSWGNLLSAVWGSPLNPTPTFTTLQNQIWLTIFPSLMIFLTVFTFNQLGEGLREAFDAEARG